MVRMEASTRRTSPVFDEADLLRAAALILRELDDRRPHPWADVIEAARDLTEDGSRKAAGSLVYSALTTYLGDVPMIWTGAKGERTLALRPAPEIALSMSCPRCDAPVGAPCTHSTGSPKRWPHDERERVSAAVC